MEQVDSVVIGAGVVGLAIARALARAGREVLVLERNPQFGMETSARNSEVIHAGIYYPTGSLKALLCVRGRALLYEYCESRGVSFRRCGKLIVAADETQVAGLEKIDARAQASGVDDLVWLRGDEARAMEPALSCHRALLSPSTGIIDSHGLMLSYLGEAEDHGAMLATRSRVVGIEPRRQGEGGFVLRVAVDGEPDMVLGCRQLVNSAGLGAPAIAALLGEALPREDRPRAWLAKGNYFSLSGRCPFSRLIYPIPNEAGLGVHLTLDLGGQGRFGPDVEWIEIEDYEVDPRRSEGFHAEIRRYWPGLPENALQPAYSGIRPKVVGPESDAADFVVRGPRDHGLAGFVNLLGIESPGLTSSLALAERVLGQLD